MDFMLRAKDTGSPNVERIIARGFVILGGLFWTLVFFSVNTKASYATFVYTLPEVQRAVMYALVPLSLAVGAFVLGMYYERVAGAVLLIAAGAMIVYGVMAHLDEVVLWITAVAVLVGPTLAAAILYFFAARTQEFQELKKQSAPKA